MTRKFWLMLSAAASILFLTPTIHAQEVTSADLATMRSEQQVVLDTLWVLVTGFLVFWMNAGFGCVEAGFCRAKNAVNILGKNFVVFALSTLAYWAIGWGIMFGNGNAFMGQTGWFVSGPDNSPVMASLDSVITDELSAAYKKKTGKELDVKSDEFKPTAESISTIGSDLTAKTAESAEPKKYVASVTVKDVPGYGDFQTEIKSSSYYYGSFSAISWTGVPLMAKFFFQLVFAGTAATIVSGCVAERIHYRSFMFFCVFIVGVSYPITGHWIWGGGWLGADWNFWDFAGSTVVHSVGGWAGLAGILLLGPRLGKYRPDGKIQPIPGHNMGLAFLGGLILWLGWFGFNPGSTMAAAPNDICHIVITTNLACAAGLISATALAWGLLGKPDISMTINGALAGLVAITAPCAWVTPVASVIIGLIGGILVVLAVIFFDKIRIDDPVGALSVHLVNGIWGTLAIGLFANPEVLGYSAGPAAGLFVGGGPQQLIDQLVGVAAVAVFTFGGALIVWGLIKAIIGLRVEPEVEIAGLDITEMGMEAYNGFQVVDPHEHISADAEPRSAKLPPSGERFAIVVEGVNNGELITAWSALCQPAESENNADFKSIYPFMTTVQGNRFTFRGGNPQDVRNKVESIFKGRLRGDIHVRLESPA